MIFDNKVRIRSKDELIAQNDGLIIIKNTLDDLGVTNYLSSGTLLGAVRDNDFIPWDWDVQMYLVMENAYPLRYKISKSLIDSGFTIYKFKDCDDSLKWDIRKEEAVFELTAWYLQGKWRYRKKKSMRVPSYLFEGVFNINFKDVKYRTLNPPEEYLKFCYGDWKTPVRSSDKEIYSTTSHLRKYTVLNKFILFFNKIPKKLITLLSRKN